MKTPKVPSQELRGAASRYEQLRSERDQFLTRAREAAKLTIPSLVPPEGHSGSDDLYKPFQSLGSRGVNNLASKMVMALFPPNTPPFRWKVDDLEMERQLAADKEFKSKMDEALAKGERIVQSAIETNHIRTDAFETLKYEIVAGNALVHKPRKGRMRVYSLSQYVVDRDFSGELLEVILKETISPSALPAKYQKVIEQSNKTDSGSPDKNVELFTWVRRLPNGSWNIHQEVKGIILQDSISSYPKDKCPWLPLRWTKIQGENYGRGFIEELQGDLQSLEGLQRAIVEGSAAGAKVLFLVNPNGVTNVNDLATKPNGGFAEGNEADVTTLQLDKFNDFQVALKTIEMISARLEKAFLVNSSIQRNGERVTAEEIRFLAGELETTLGGVYAVQGQEFQLPLINILIDGLQAEKKLPKFPSENLRPTIVTGLEALGRNNDLTKLDQFLAETAQLITPLVEKYMSVGEIFRRRGTALGLDTKGLVKTDEQLAEAAKAEQAQAAMQSLGPQMISGGAKILDTQTKASLAPQVPAAA
jgi:hypothetical protein